MESPQHEKQNNHPSRHHFLVVAYPIQGHLNPARHLAARLLYTIPDSRITFSTTISGHRLMFPSFSSPGEEGIDDICSGGISYIPFSDGYDDGFNPNIHDHNDLRIQTRKVGSKTLSAIVDRLCNRGQPITCIIYTFLLPWAASVAGEHGIPSALYWIQPVIVLAIYYHYLHGYKPLIAAHVDDPEFTVSLPGLPSFKICELPSLVRLTNRNNPHMVLLDVLGELFESLDVEDKFYGRKPTVLVNTFDALESDQLNAIERLELRPIGPVQEKVSLAETNLVKVDEREHYNYMEWLDTKPAKSVIYVSFGSLSVLKKQQLEELKKGLEASSQPYLWVVIQNNREEGLDLDNLESQGMVVEWCNQVKVLSHPSVGCFVTHCGWNSTLESMTWGIPMVAVPQVLDQITNAWLVEEIGVGVKAVVGEEKVLHAEELRSCLEAVMGEGETAKEFRKNAEIWKERAREAVQVGGSSENNFRAFVAGLAHGVQPMLT